MQNSRFYKGTTSVSLGMFLELEELKAFLGILIFMGIVKLPRRELYWTSWHMIRVELVARTFKQRIQRNRTKIHENEQTFFYELKAKLAAYLPFFLCKLLIQPIFTPRMNYFS